VTVGVNKRPGASQCKQIAFLITTTSTFTLASLPLTEFLEDNEHSVLLLEGVIRVRREAESLVVSLPWRQKGQDFVMITVLVITGVMAWLLALQRQYCE
jgi:hypothetical protein